MADNPSNTLNTNVAKAVLQMEFSYNRERWKRGYIQVFITLKRRSVKWIITGDKLNSCNNAIIVPSFKLEMNINRENLVKNLSQKQ